MLKFESVTELQDVRDRLTPKLLEDLDVPAGTLTAIIFVSILGSLAFSGLLIAQQAAADKRQQLADERSKKARRLLRLAEDKEVIPPPTASAGGYHLFLSHSQQDGGDHNRTKRGPRYLHLTLRHR